MRLHQLLERKRPISTAVHGLRIVTDMFLYRSIRFFELCFTNLNQKRTKVSNGDGGKHLDTVENINRFKKTTRRVVSVVVKCSYRDECGMDQGQRM